MASQSVANRSGSEPAPGTWSRIKEWSGYVVTVLPYVSAGLVLIPSLGVWIKAGILVVFVVLVLVVRICHEKAGIAVTAPDERQKRPSTLRTRSR